MASGGVVLSQPNEKGGMMSVSGGVPMNPIAQQPSAYAGPAVPPGLEYLATQNLVHVHQVMHAVEVLTGFEKNNVYRICNAQEQQFMHAKEDTECCMRQWCGQAREFNMYLSDMNGQQMIHMYRPLRCQGVCCPCCLQEMEINYGGSRVATIHEIWTCCIPRYEVRDVSGNVLFKITGDCCYCKCCTDVVFKVSRANDVDAGEIHKHWGGCREMFGQVNDFTLTYAPDETPINKAILLGATFLVDFMYFEYKN